MDVHSTNTITSSATISLLRKTFASFGLPDTVVSDNAPNFCSKEMDEFFERNGVKHVTPAPYNPPSNGLAERAVRTFKEGLHKFKDGDINVRICRFLYNQRRTACASTGKAPSEMLMGRCFKGPLNSLQKEKKKKGRVDDDIPVLPQFKLHDAVFVRNFGKGESWVPGKIAEVLGVRNYKVQLQDYGNVFWKRHADQIMPRYLTKQVEGDKISLPNFVSSKESLNNSGNMEFQGKSTGSSNNVDSEVHVQDDVGNTPVINDNPPLMSPRVVSEKRTASGRIVKPPIRLNL